MGDAVPEMTRPSCFLKYTALQHSVRSCNACSVHRECVAQVEGVNPLNTLPAAPSMKEFIEKEIAKQPERGPNVSTDKHTNPKDAIGCDKLPLHLWPTTASAMGCLGLLEGLLKYGRTNWRESGVRASIYVDACKRHLDAWFEGEEVAPDSGVPHLANALACLAIIVDAAAAGKLVDDRAYRGKGYRQLVEALTPHVARMKAMHADKSPKHYTKEDERNG